MKATTKTPKDNCAKCGCVRGVHRHRTSRSRHGCSDCPCMAFYERQEATVSAREAREAFAKATANAMPESDWVEIDMGNNVRKRVRKTSAAPPPPKPLVAMCPLAPHIPLASVGVIGAYIAMSPAARTNLYVTRPSPTLILVANLPPTATHDTAAKTLGPGGFFLVCFGHGQNVSVSVGESIIVVPGEERSKTVIALQNGERERRVAEVKAASEKQAADAAFSTQLHSDEEALVKDLAEINHAVVHAKFASATDQGAHLEKALLASERGIKLLVDRLSRRPGKESWWATSSWILGGVGVVATMVYAALVGKPNAGEKK